MKSCVACRVPISGPGWRCPSCSYSPTETDGIFSFAPELADHVEGYDPAHFAALAQVEPHSFWFENRNELVRWALRRAGCTAGEFLEIGCGTGWVLQNIERSFPDLVTSGSEVLAVALPTAIGRLRRSRLYQMDARRIPFRDDFEGIGLFDVLEHIEEDDLVLAEIHAALKPGGHLFLTVPQHARLWSAVDQRAGHRRRYGANQLQDLLERSGFEVSLTTSFVTLLLPLMFVARRADPQRNLSDDLRPSPVVNAALRGIMTIERCLIRAGIRLPVGGSLLVVAKKPG